MKKITALFMLALSACAPSPSTDNDAERERVIKEVAAAREAARLAMPTQQAFSIPCPPTLCSPDITTVQVTYCAKWYPAQYHDCGDEFEGDDLFCDFTTYINMVPPTSGMVRFWIKEADSMFGNGQPGDGVCFEIDTYQQNGKVGVPDLGFFHYGGIWYSANNATNVHMRTGILHAAGGVWEHTSYNTHLSGASSGQGTNESNWHTLGYPGWVSSVAGFYKP